MPPTTFDSPLEAVTLAQGNFGRTVVNANANDGAGAVTLSSAVVTNIDYTVNFCPFEVGACPTILGHVMADSNGKGSRPSRSPRRARLPECFAYCPMTTGSGCTAA